MKNINWKVRFKNPQFIAQVIVSIIVPILTYFGIEGRDITSWNILAKLVLDAVSNPYVVVMIAVSVFNAINDPTTSGLKDSVHALDYSEPKK